MAFTVEWLLQQDFGEGFSLLAGNMDELIPITGVNIMDNPDTLPWLVQGTMVLSTGYLFEEGKLDQNIVRNLKKQGCAGLGIKMNRYLKELPEYILRQAEECHFPIINIPFSASLGEISRIIYRQIYEEEMTEAQKIGLIYSEISKSLLLHQNLAKSVQIIQEATNSDIFLTNDAFELIEYSLPTHASQDFPFSFSKNAYTLFSDADTNELKQLLQGNLFPVYTHIVNSNGQKLEFHIYPLINRGSILGYLIILKTIDTTASALELLLNLRSSFCLALLNKVMLTESERSSRDIFFHNLLSGTLQNEQEIERLCIQNSFPFHENRICILLKIAEYEQMSLSKRRAYERNLFSLIDQLNTELKVVVIHSIFQTSFVLFYFPGKMMSQTNYSKNVRSYANKLLSKLNAQKIHPVISLSKCSQGASTIYANYQQTIQELQIGQKLHPKESILSYYDDEMDQLFLEHFNMEQLRSFSKETLAPLEEYDSQNQTELLKTLDAYITCNNNMAQTAKTLFIHRNTCAYRLEQIHEILSINLSDADSFYRIQTALRIRRLLEFV